MTFNAAMEHILKLDSLRLGGEVRKGETGWRLKDAEEADRQQG
jgi:antirestriction protein ArdC